MSTTKQVTDPVADVIEQLAGLSAGDATADLLALRVTARQQAQTSHDVLLATPPAESLAHVALDERYAVALFTALLHGQAAAGAFYREGLLRHRADGEQLAQAVELAVAQAQALRADGPYGEYPAGPLSAEDEAGPQFEPDAALVRKLGQRLAAALAHAQLLVLHPRDASAAALQRLLDAGWSASGIVTLSQLVSFLAFQLRVAAGLAVLADSRAA